MPIQLAHEATLQNIRYLKNLIEESNEDLWLQTINMNMMLNKTVEALDNRLMETQRNNSITNIIQSSVDAEDIEVLLRSQSGQWDVFDGTVSLDPTTKMYSLNANSLTLPGNYTVLLRPKRETFDVISDTYSIANDLIDTIMFRSDTFNKPTDTLYNFTIELYNGDDIVGESLITSNHDIGINSYLRLSPMISADAVTSFKLYDNSFIPITIDIEITNHSDDTIGYAMYGRKEFNAETGRVDIYDDNGNVFASYTVGKETNEAKDIVEFRRKATHE